jgi:adenylate kinase
MIILLTGTPGTGKTTVSRLFSKKYGFRKISINDIATSEVCEGVEKGSRLVNIEKLSDKISQIVSGDAIIEGHLSHYLPYGDIVIVLRTRPDVLEKRLIKKGFDKDKIAENLEAEALDVCLIESIERHRKVYEIDTTKKKVPDVVADMKKILEGRWEEFVPGKIDWSENFFDVKRNKKKVM